MIFQDPNKKDYGPWKPVAVLLLILVAAGIGDALNVLGEADGAENVQIDGDFEMYSPANPNAISYIVPYKKWVGTVDIVVNTEGATFSPAWIEQNIQWAIDYVNMYVDIDLQFQGFTNAQLVTSYDESRRQTLLVAFPEMSLLGQSQFWYDFELPGVINYSQIRIGSNTVTPLCFQGIFLHELLHSLNIPHTEDRNSIMSVPYYDCLYMKVLRLHDIVALQDRLPVKPNRAGIITSYDSTQVCGYQPEVIVDGQSYSVTACIPASGFSEVIIN